MIVEGIQLESVWLGERGGRELVFLHEGLGSITQWRDTPANISAASGCAALVYARRGYGKSDPVVVPRPLTYMHDEAALVPKILAEEHVVEPVLIGHSDGASIAVMAAASARAIVLIAPHVFVEDVSIASIAAARDGYAELRGKLARHHADVDGAFWGWNRAWLDPEFRNWNLEKFLPAITVPVLVIQGADDEYGTLAQVDAIARQVSGRCETFIVPGAGHSPHRSHPAEVHGRIVEFIRSVE